MWIKTDNDALTKLAPEGVDPADAVEFNDSNSAQVTKELGERLIEEFEDIHAKEENEVNDSFPIEEDSEEDSDN